MKLISMVDFVLQLESVKISVTDANKELEERYLNIISYANFLKQPLILGMFVPVDKKGNPLTQPSWANSKGEKYFKADMTSFLEAEQKVLFENFEVEGVNITNWETTFNVAEIGGYKIEDAIHSSIILTHSAIKQIR